jgi:5-methylcytosine-specific restriction endonuclease McrA
MGLLNQIANDEIVLPAIQRDFVWSEGQTQTLLDSVMRGYPIGIALLWETYNDIQYRRFQREFRHGTIPTYVDNSGRSRLRVVLDGQQRLQSLFIALHGQLDGRTVYFDVLSGQRWDSSEDERYLFEYSTRPRVDERNAQAVIDAADRDDSDDAETPEWLVSVQELFRMPPGGRRDLIKHLRSNLRLTDDELGLLEENLDTFVAVFTREENILKVSTIDENLPADSPYRKSETDVLEIFVRINREGTSLSRSDLIFSMLKLNWKESAEGLPEFVEAINEGNSFDLNTDFVIRCLFAVSGLGGKLNIDLLRSQTNVEKLRTNFSECCDAIRATVDFVQTECRCQSSRLLGSSTTLVPIVDYMFGLPRHEVPNDEVDRLRTAVYIFGLAQPFSRYGESRVGNFVRSALDTRDAGDHRFPLEAAIERVRSWEGIRSIEDLAEWNHDLTLHLVQGLSGARVQYARNAPEVDHIFPRSELRKQGKNEEDIDDLANFWILAQGKNRNKSNRRPKDYFADVSDTQLKKALIDRSMLDYRQFKKFIRQRREGLLRELSKKLLLTDDDLRRG